jgi:phage terminase Nu1 subunit (DNA packaging protein)
MDLVSFTSISIDWSQSREREVIAGVSGSEIETEEREADISLLDSVAEWPASPEQATRETARVKEIQNAKSFFMVIFLSVNLA